MVRHSEVDDDAAHWMAIAAMDQYGWMLASWGIGTTDMLKTPRPSAHPAALDGITCRGVLLTAVGKPVVSDVVDPCFIRFVIRIVSGRISSMERTRNGYSDGWRERRFRERVVVQPFKGYKRDTIGILGGATNV